MIVGGMKFRGHSNGDRKKKNKVSGGSPGALSRPARPKLVSAPMKPPSFSPVSKGNRTPTKGKNKNRYDSIEKSTPETLMCSTPSPQYQWDKFSSKGESVDDDGDSVDRYSVLDCGEDNDTCSLTVNFEAADDDELGVEMVVESSANDFEQKVAVNIDLEKEKERQEYKKMWKMPPRTSLNEMQKDPMLGIEFHTSSYLINGNGFNKCADEISDASLPSAFYPSENISKAAVRAVSVFFDKNTLDSHLPPDAKTSPHSDNHGSLNFDPDSTPVKQNHIFFDKNLAGDAAATQTKRDIEELTDRLIAPSKQLADLCGAIRQGQDYVRRKNACGALKIMTSKVRNRKKIAWTMGVLPAIADVLNDNGEDFNSHGNERANINVRKAAYIEARLRSVFTLLNLCSLPENRVLIFNCPRLVDGMIQTIYNDKLESRQGICACFSLLAKTIENRAPIVKTTEIITALMSTIAVKADKDEDKRANPESVPKYLNENDSYPLKTASSDMSKNLDSSNSTTVSKITASTNNHDRYDKTNLPLLQGARVHILACCLHLVKDREAVYCLVRNVTFMATIIEVANRFDSPAHTRCIVMIAYLSRLRANIHRMVYRVKFLLRTLVRATNSDDAECRKYACLTLENLSCERSCRKEIASVPGLIPALCLCSTNMGHEDQQLAATSALRNLADEPANLIPFTDSEECLASLIKLVRLETDEDSEEKTDSKNKLEMIKFYASDAIASISFWMTTIATTNVNRVNGNENCTSISTLNAIGWELWE